MVAFCFLSTSLLFKLTVFLSGKSQACLKTVTTPPGTVVPPCATCTTNSFYVTDECNDNDGCIVIPPTQVVTEAINAGGCKEADMVCPDGSLVVVDFGNGPESPVDWASFSTVLDNFVCSDDGTWLMILNGQATTFQSIYCYNKRCALCPDLPAATPEQCAAPNCLPANVTYTPAMPTPTDFCRRIFIRCPEPTDQLPNVRVNFVFTDGTSKSFSIPEFSAGTAGTFACNNESIWTLTSPPPNSVTETMATITCLYSA